MSALLHEEGDYALGATKRLRSCQMGKEGKEGCSKHGNSVNKGVEERDGVG